jgi:hypothetical protein
MKLPFAGAIDCDLHPAVPDVAALMPYLDDFWREHLTERYIDHSPFRAGELCDEPAAIGAAGLAAESGRAGGRSRYFASRCARRVRHAFSTSFLRRAFCAARALV